MSRVSVSGWRHEGILHLEIEGGIVNVREGLHDLKGRAVTSVEVIAESERKLIGSHNTRLVAQS